MEDLPRRDDPIHRIFKRLRDGFSEVVVNIAERVERRIQIFIDDERHEQPPFEHVVQDALLDVFQVVSGVTSAATATPAAPEPPTERDPSENDEP